LDLEINHLVGSPNEAGYILRPLCHLRPWTEVGNGDPNIDPHQAQLINRMRRGQMILAGQALYILEVEPAAYAPLAANEAEKAALINILEVQPFGSFGRVYLGGEERDILAGSRAALAAIDQLQGVNLAGLERKE